MKIHLKLPTEKKASVQKYLEEKGIEISENAEYVLSENTQSGNLLSVRKSDNGDKAFLDPNEILYIESFGHQLEFTCKNGKYLSSDPLYALEEMLNPTYFTRINKSTIVANEQIREIKPTLSMKFILIMTDEKYLEVTRSYYNKFRNTFNI